MQPNKRPTFLNYSSEGSASNTPSMSPELLEALGPLNRADERVKRLLWMLGRHVAIKDDEGGLEPLLPVPMSLEAQQVVTKQLREAQLDLARQALPVYRELKDAATINPSLESLYDEVWITRQIIR